MSDKRDAKEREAFGGRLFQLRSLVSIRQASLPMSQVRFARFLGIEAERYRRWERGEMEPPLGMLVHIRRMTGISLDWLIAGEKPGSGMNPNEEVTFCVRLKWARQLLSPTPEQAADLMSVERATWAAWEQGEASPPIAKMVDFCQRYGVGLDFLYRGQLTGLSPRMGQALLERHPELRSETSDAAPASNDTQMVASIDKVSQLR